MESSNTVISNSHSFVLFPCFLYCFTLQTMVVVELYSFELIDSENVIYSFIIQLTNNVKETDYTVTVKKNNFLCASNFCE